MQTKERTPARAGRIRRLLMGERIPDLPIVIHEDEEGFEEFAPIPPPNGRGGLPQLLEVRTLSEPDIQMLYFRLERVETGLKLVADTMKRAVRQLGADLERIQRQTGDEAVATQVQRVLARSLEPVQSAIEQLAERVSGIPMVLAAATDELTRQVESSRQRVVESVGTMIRARRIEARARGPLPLIEGNGGGHPGNGSGDPAPATWLPRGLRDVAPPNEDDSSIWDS